MRISDMESGTKRLLLVTGIVLLQLIAVYAGMLSLQRGLTSQFKDNAQVTLDELAESVVDRSTRFLMPVQDAVSVGVTLINEGILDVSDDAALETYFNAQLTTTPWLAGMFLGRADGSFVYLARNEYGMRTKRIAIKDNNRTVELVQRDLAGTLTEQWTDTEDDYDPRSRSWYQKAQATDAVAWTDPYVFFSSGLSGISAAAQTKDGVILGADVELAELSAFIDDIPHAKNGTALIIDGSRNVIANSGTLGALANPDQTEIPQLADIAQAPLLSLHAVTRTDAGNTELVELNIEHQSYLGLSRTFPIVDNVEPWTLLVQMQADDYAGGALNFLNREIMLLGTLSLGLAALAIGGMLWLHRSSPQNKVVPTRDPISGALLRQWFESTLSERYRKWPAESGKHLGVMIVEARGLNRLADRLGFGCRDAVIAGIGHRLESSIKDDDILGISPNGRYLIAIEADSRTALRERIDRIHETVTKNTEFQTPLGLQNLPIVSGAAMLELDEPVINLLPRAREALTLGIERGCSDCQIATGLDGDDFVEQSRAA